MKSIETLLKSIKKDFSEKKFDKFIHDITFPKFKRIAPGTIIEFKFPITVLVGPNGAGKSSILHALWGTPKGYSTSRFWFSTKVDPIEDFGNGVPRYWYSHFIKELDQVVQTRKVFGTKRLGYWEPSKPSTQDGMKPVEKGPGTEYRSSDRWSPVVRDVTYINTKAETSAFDRFFYQTNGLNLQKRQETFVYESGRLQNVISKGLAVQNIGKGQFVFSNDDIAPESLKVINQILGKEYTSASRIVHRFYDRNAAPSVIFRTKAHTYSESFAGSGELAVVNMVLELEKISPRGLLLLDEPETSLHPGAQTQLINYLLQIIDEKKIQVVVSTHSPTFVDMLPEEALIVLDETADGTKVTPNATKASAFYKLGHPDPNRYSIFVEDPLLKVMVEVALYRNTRPELRNNCDVIAATCGVSEMLSHHVPVFVSSKLPIIMVLDGDQKPLLDLLKDPEQLSPEQKTELVATIKKDYNVNIVGSNPDVDGWLKWVKKHVIVIDETCPEQVFTKILNPDLVGLDAMSNAECKKKMKSILNRRGDDTSAQAAPALFRSKLNDSYLANGFVVQSLESLANKLQTALKEVPLGKK